MHKYAVLCSLNLHNKNRPARAGRLDLLFCVIQIEVAVLAELLARLFALSGFTGVGVKLLVKTHVLRTLVPSDEIGILLHGMSFVVAHNYSPDFNL